MDLAQFPIKWHEIAMTKLQGFADLRNSHFALAGHGAQNISQIRWIEGLVGSAKQVRKGEIQHKGRDPVRGGKRRDEEMDAMTRGEEMAKQLVHERVIGETRYQYKRKLVQMGRQIIADTFGAEYINDEGFPVLPLATQHAKDFFGRISKSRFDSVTKILVELPVDASEKDKYSPGYIQGFKSALGWWCAEHEDISIDMGMDAYINQCTTSIRRKRARAKKSGDEETLEGKRHLSGHGRLLIQAYVKTFYI